MDEFRLPFVCGFGRPWAVFCAIAVVIGAGSCGGDVTTTASSNVLLIVVDTLRADHVSVYGSKHATPNIDALAARGVTFKRAYSHIPITGPSHSSLFTALLPFEHGVHNNGQILDPQFQTLAEILGDDGRSTAAVVSLGVLKRKFGLARGFDTYRDDFSLDWMKDAGEVNEEVFEILDGMSAKPYFLWVHYSDPHEPYAPPGLEHPRIRLELNGAPVGELLAGGRSGVFDLELNPGVNELRFVDTSSTKRRLYRLTNIRIPKSSIEVKLPEEWKTREKRVGSPSYQGVFPATVELVNPGAEPQSVILETACKRVLRNDEIRERYALEVEYVDDQIGRLLDRMRERGLLDDTLIVFASDHGEGLGDHKHVGHISQLYDSLLRVPLILSQPGCLPEGLTVEQPVSLVDVLPTITDVLDLPNPAAASGVSLLPLIRGAKEDPRPVFGVTSRPEAYSDKTAVVARGYKFIHSLTDDRDWEELYDLEVDPGELVDLAPSAPPILDELRSLLRTRLRSSAMAEVNEASLSEEEIERLRALGYIH
jgi:arylsulfatase A-like enzyme